MKTINWYIGRSLLVSMLLALGVLTFVMLSGHFFRAFELLTKGVRIGLLVRFVLYMVPDMLRFTLPLSVLVSTVLVFGRMSSDNEISALKASGVGLWQIIAPGLILSFICCIICLSLSLVISPICRYEATRLRWKALASAPLTLLEPGTFTSISQNCQLRIEGRDGDDLLGVHLILRQKNGGVVDVVAERGRIEADFEERLLMVTFTRASLTELDFSGETVSSRANLRAYELELPVDYGDSLDKRELMRKSKYMTMDMLFGRMRLEAENGNDITPLLLDFHGRVSLSMSAFSFLLLGLPFGIRGKRSELSVGLLICVVLALGFYVFMLLADRLEAYPKLHPEWIIWIPNLLYLIGGLVAIRRLGKH
ncbi:MAG: LptF/LptG family permease [Victivallales bacterium]|nr:LptF/LptG family permease [Victivallales bacterium]